MSNALPRQWQDQDDEDGRTAMAPAEARARAVAKGTAKERRDGLVEASRIASRGRAVRARGGHQRPLVRSIGHHLAELAGCTELAIEAAEMLHGEVLTRRREDGLDTPPVMRTDVDGGTTGQIRLDASVSTYGAPGNWWRRNK